MRGYPRRSGLCLSPRLGREPGWVPITGCVCSSRSSQHVARERGPAVTWTHLPLSRGMRWGSRGVTPNLRPPRTRPAHPVSLPCPGPGDGARSSAPCRARGPLARLPRPVSRGRGADLHQGRQREERGHEPVARPPQAGGPAPRRRRHGLRQLGAGLGTGRGVGDGAGSRTGAWLGVGAGAWGEAMAWRRGGVVLGGAWRGGGRLSRTLSPLLPLGRDLSRASFSSPLVLRGRWPPLAG